MKKTKQIMVYKNKSSNCEGCENNIEAQQGHTCQEKMDNVDKKEQEDNADDYNVE